MAADEGHDVVFLFDVDETLLDNDRVKVDIEDFFARQAGAERTARYWEIYEGLRLELGYADFLGALQRYRLEHIEDAHLLRVALYMLNVPFADRLFPRALDVLRHVQQWGPAVIVSDGDVVFQPLKVQHSGLLETADDTLIYVHKERRLDLVEQRWPARHYVMFDDKLRIHTSLKQHWGSRVTTVLVRQGHYAMDPAEAIQHPPADLAVDAIEEVLQFALADLVPGR